MIQSNYRKSALDTETVKGYARILSTEYRVWQAKSFEDCIRPLFFDYEDGKTGNIFFGWNMDYDLRAIFKYLPEKTLKSMVDSTKELPKTLVIGRYEIFYVPERFCSITDIKSAEEFYNKTILYFFNISQFFGYMSLDNAGKDHIGKRKTDSDTIEYFKEFENTDEFIYHNSDELMRYCKADATLTKELGDYMSGHIQDLFGLDLKTFSSFGTIAQEMTVGGERYKLYPHVDQRSKKYKYASKAFHGGWFEVKKRGFFDKVTDIDISSAYPATMITLPHWGNGDMHPIDYLFEIKEDDYYGWVLCEFDCPYIPYTGFDGYVWEEYHDGKTFQVEANNPKKYYPDGKRIQIITLLEYRFLLEYGFYVKLNKGCVWRPNSDKKDKYQKPFLWVEEAYNRKNQLKKAGKKKSYEYSLNKLAMNSGYGKTCQQVGHPKMQDMFYASYITAECRIKIIKFILDNKFEDKYIMIATDGILIEGHHELDLSKGLGGWDVEYYDEALILAAGIYQLNSKSGNKIAMRGLNRQKDLKEEDHDLISLIKEHKNETSFIPYLKEKPLGMAQAMNYINIYTKEDINIWKERGRALNIDTDRKLKWFGINTFNDLLNNNFIGERFTVKELEDEKEKRKKEEESEISV